MRVENPDHVVTHAPPKVCDSCARALPEPVVVETRQVFDLPEIRHEVTEHQVLQTQCRCGKLRRGAFPEEVSAPVQYGPRVLATAVYLATQQIMPLQRTAEAIDDLFGLPVSEATVVAACEEAEVRLQPAVDAIAASFQAAPVAHADESGMRINGSLHWMHVVVTALVTWIGVHKKRGWEGMKELGVLSVFFGTLVHDGWKSYRDREARFLHALCNAHHPIFASCSPSMSKDRHGQSK